MDKWLKKNPKKITLMTAPFNLKRLVFGIVNITGLCIVSHDVYSSEITDIKKLDEIVVEILDLTEEQIAKQNLEKVAGGVNLIELNYIENSKLSNNEDVFKLQPGIYAKSSGNEGTKISIRGSGINRAPGAHASGLFVLLDDIPFTGPGGTPYELLEPTWLKRVEVFRGANGFEKGSLALGGAINYISKTGQDAHKLELKSEIGSRGYQKHQMSSGQAFENFDYYLSLNTAQADGYQKHSQNSSKGITGNIGIQLSPYLETRFYIRHRETEHQTPGRLTKQQIENDPKAANAYNLQYDAKRIQPGSTWLANKTNYSLDNGGTLQGSFAYHYYPMDLRESPYRTDVKYSDLTANLVYAQPYNFLDLHHDIKIGLRSTTHRPDSGVKETLRFDLNGYEAGTLTRKYTYRGSDNVLNIHNDTELQPDLWVTLGTALIYTHRQSEVYYPITNQKVDLNEWDLAPRLGMRYQINPHMQVYTNLSRTIEPPHPWSLIWSSYHYFDRNSGAASGRQKIPVVLKNQVADTFEIGGRGENIIGKWDFSYYYSKLKNELLSVEISPLPNMIVSESNASDTIHEGVEIGLNSHLYNYNNIADIRLIQTYNYSNFKYKNDHNFGKNRLAGIPEHYYQGRLLLDLDGGYYASVNAEYVSKIPVDYANTYYSDNYTLWGASLGYKHPNDTWNAWLTFNNLTNKKYASALTPSYNDLGVDNARSNSGEGFSTYAGLSLKF